MPEPRESDGLQQQQIPAARPDWIVAALAERQHGVVARRQLLTAGLTAEMLRTRLDGRRLLPLHRGVYAVGHRRLRREGHWLAAVLAAGPGAVLSHREAAALHGLRPAERSTVDVTVAAQRRVSGAQVHRVARLANVRAALTELAKTGTTLTLSQLEDCFVALLDAHGLPRPATNVLVAGCLVDACWQGERVAAETAARIASALRYAAAAAAAG